MLIYFLIFLASSIISIIITPYVIKFCKKYNIVDIPDKRKIHKEPIPRLGGLAVIISIIITIVTFFTLINLIEPSFFKIKYFKYSLTQIVGIIVSLITITLVGIIDDIKNLQAKTKLLFQFLVANILFFTGTKISFITILNSNPVHLTDLLSYVLTILWIVGLTNAINLIDGLDGALSGISSIISFTLGIIAISQGQTVLALFAFSLSGALIGFLKYNFNPAKIFLGDTGSLFIGMYLSIISILGYFKKATVISLVVPLVLFAIPILDTLLAIIRRIIKKQHIFKPDKEHIHHKLLQMGLSQKQAALILYFITIFLSIIALYFVKP